MRLQYLIFLAITASALRAQPPTLPVQQAPTSPSALAPDSAAIPTIRATTRSVILDVIVTDQAGRPATGLTRQNFVVRENGVPQPITSIEAIHPGAQPSESTPRTILLIDAMNTRFEDMAFTRYAVNRLLHQSGAQLDHPIALYVLTNHGLHVAQTFTRSTAALDAALRAVLASLPWRLTSDSDSMLERVNLSMVALQQIATANYGVPGHKDIVWISPGFPLFATLNINQTGRQRLADELRHLSNKLLEARITIDSVDPRGVIPPPVVDLPLLGHRQQPLEENNVFDTYLAAIAESSHTNFSDIAVQTLARQTGGHVFFGRNDIDIAIANGIRDGGTYHTLSYTPAHHDFHGEFRKVQVDLTPNPALAARTRDGYYALLDDSTTRAARQYDELGASLFTSLDYPAIPIPLTQARHRASPAALDARLLIPATALTWEPDAQGRFQCRLMLATADRSHGGMWRQSMVRPYRITMPQGTRPTPQQQASIDFAMPYRQSNQLRFIVQDQASGRIGSSEYTLRQASSMRP